MDRAEEARPVRDRGAVVRLVARLCQPSPILVHVLHLEAEVPLDTRIRLHGIGEEVELELTVACREPDQSAVAERVGHGLLFETYDARVERAQLGLRPSG
jgi:hypothetical protein